MHNYSQHVTKLPVNKPDLTAHNEETARTLCILEIRVIRYNRQLVTEHTRWLMLAAHHMCRK